MARVRGSYETPIHGVSTLAPRNRARGQAGLQVNMRSDPVTKLTRRPSLTWETKLLDTTDDIVHHSYYRKSKSIQYIISADGTVHGFVDNIEKPVTGTLGSYGTSRDLLLETINDTTFVVNPTVATALTNTTDRDTTQKVSHLNVTSGLNYGSTTTITVLDTFGSAWGASAVIVIPDGVSSVADADEERATNAVATEIAAQLNVNTAGVTATAKGSSVAVQLDDNSQWVVLEVDSGNGDDVIAINEQVENVEGLPLYAMPGTRITVQPDPTDTDGTYYLEAVTLQGEVTGSVQEVVWKESRSLTEPYEWDADTMPRVIIYDYDTDEFTVGYPTNGWADREAGDDESCPPPDFLGRKITALGHFQKRLILVSDNDVSMTRTDDLFDWWKQSAVGLLVTDPIGVTSNSTGIDVLQYIIEHNRDLLFVASNGQFKIEGTVGITPQTVAMPLTTTQEIQVSTAPVAVGSDIYMPINYGTSSGITRYSGTRDKQDIATPVTHHVIGYMLGEAKILVGSPNLEMLAMTTDGGASNEIYIYEQFAQGGKTSQQSWSKWLLPEDNEILAMVFRRDKLSVVVRVNGKIIAKSINMYSSVATNTHDIYLDDFMALSTAGTYTNIPTDYPTEGMIVVMGENTAFPLEKIPYTVDGTTVTFSEDIGEGTVYIGKPYTSRYRPTRPFQEDQAGIAVTDDRLRISRYILNVVDTGSVYMHIDTEHYDWADQEQSPRVLNRSSNVLGVVSLYTGDYSYSFAQDANLAEAEFYTEGYLGMTIAGISWQGQHHKSSGRM